MGGVGGKWAVVVRNRKPQADLAAHNSMVRHAIFPWLHEDLLVEEYEVGSGHCVLVVDAAPDTGGPYMAMSFCSPKDDHDLLKGLTIALGRLRKAERPVCMRSVTIDDAYLFYPDLFPSWAAKAMEEC